MLFIQRDWNLEGGSFKGVSPKTRFKSFWNKKGNGCPSVGPVEQNFSPVCMDTDVLWFKPNVKKKVLLPHLRAFYPTLQQNSWVGEPNGMTEWPPILLSDITLYVTKDHPGNDILLRKRLLNEYQEAKAYRLYSEGWLKEIYVHPVNDSCKHCFLKEDCAPSMK